MTFAVSDSNDSRKKYVGRCKAKVIDNRDPQTKGRVRLLHPLFGPTSWIPYLQTGHMFDMPSIGDLVYTESDGGYESYQVAWGKCLTNQAEEVPLAESFQKLVPNNRGIYSPGGHLFEVDDGTSLTAGTPPTSDVGIRLTTSDGSKIHMVEDLADKTITIERNEGQKLVLDGLVDKIEMETVQGQSFLMQAGVGVAIESATGDALNMGSNAVSLSNSGGSAINFDPATNTITIEDILGNKIATSEFGMDLTDNSSNTILMSPGGIEMSASNSVMNITGQTAELKDATAAGFQASAGKITIGNSGVELLDLVDQTLQQLDAVLTAIQAMTVPTGVGPSGPPINAAQFTTAQTQVAIIKQQLAIIKG